MVSICIFSFLWLFAAKCFKSTLVVVLILPDVILCRNIQILVGFLVFWVLVLGFREGPNFASEDERGGFEEKAGGRRPLRCVSECSNDGE